MYPPSPLSNRTPQIPLLVPLQPKPSPQAPLSVQHTNYTTTSKALLMGLLGYLNVLVHRKHSGLGLAYIKCPLQVSCCNYETF